MNERLELFSNFCLPSVINQSNKNFKGLLFFDSSTSDKFRIKIDAILKSHSQIIPFYIGGMPKFQESISNYIKANTSDKEYLITSRIDNDDCIHIDFINEIQKQFKQQDYLAFDDDYDPKPLINRYKNCLHYVDDLIGKIISQLDKKNKLENTIIIITSDHGQEFNDSKKGYWQHGGNFSKYQINTPFILYDFNKAPKKYNHLTLHYDIAPTIMNSYLGVSNSPKDYSSGKSLFDTSKRDFFICGYNQKFAIVETNRITNIYTSGLLDVVDNNLNVLDEEPNSEYLLHTMNEIRKFYK